MSKAQVTSWGQNVPQNNSKFQQKPQLKDSSEAHDAAMQIPFQLTSNTAECQDAGMHLEARQEPAPNCR